MSDVRNVNGYGYSRFYPNPNSNREGLPDVK